MKIAESELILNPDGSVYHLNLKPKNIATDIIFVGDQDRVSKITQHFDTIEFSTQKREFKTETGIFKGKRLTVISTGIGTDNIDIVMNELDALVNIDLNTRTIKPIHTTLNIIRIGTSGALQANIPIDRFLITTHALGLDGLLHTYQADHIVEQQIEDAFISHTHWSNKRSRPYIVKANNILIKQFKESHIHTGCTATAPGFYGPQGRVLRLKLQDENIIDKLKSFTYKDLKITNLEMETAAIYGLAKLLGHQAISMNAIIANRANGIFSKSPYDTIAKLITFTLNKLVS